MGMVNFGSGGKDSNDVTKADNSNIAASGGSNVARIAGKHNVYTQTDLGSIEAAFALAGQSLQLASDSYGQATRATADTLDLYASQSRDSLGEMIALSQSPTQQLTTDVFQNGLWALVAIAGLFAIYSYKKKAS